MPMQKRRRLVVLRAFQHWFIKVFVLYMALFLGVFALGLYLWFKLLMSEVLNLSGILSDTFGALVERHLWMGFYLTLLFVMILVLIAGLQAMLFSRRIAGPLFSLSRHLEKIEKTGKFEPWKLRKGDLFMDLPEQLNSVLEKLGKGKSS